MNGYPTGVAVSWAMHHGGTYPGHKSTHGDLGVRIGAPPLAAADHLPGIRRHPLLPAKLRDEPLPGTPRRIDGVLTIDPKEQ